MYIYESHIIFVKSAIKTHVRGRTRTFKTFQTENGIMGITES